jgi:hypothetical protein
MSDNNSLTPQCTTTHWWRFSSGLWRVPEGDIAAAYCADTFPKIRVFTHEGRSFTNCGCTYSKYFAAEVNCYPLNDYYVTTEHRVTPDGRPHSPGKFGYDEITEQYYERYNTPIKAAATPGRFLLKRNNQAGHFL